MSLHAHYFEDDKGDLVDLIYFCSDSCHRDWCEREGETYGGWNGCQERPDYEVPCENCGGV